MEYFVNLADVSRLFFLMARARLAALAVAVAVAVAAMETKTIFL